MKTINGKKYLARELAARFWCNANTAANHDDRLFGKGKQGDTRSFDEARTERIRSLSSDARCVTRKETMTEVNRKPFGMKEVVDFTGFSRSYIYKLIHLGKIPFHKPTRGRIFFKPSEIEEFVYRGKHDADYEVAEKANALLNGEEGAYCGSRRASGSRRNR
jgi:excisionase family DNA binding protein